MKKLILQLIFIIFLIYNNECVYAKKLNAVFSYANFYSYGDGPFIETYLLVDGKSAEYVKNDNGLFQAKIEITMIFKQNDSVVTFSKYELSSPETDDTSQVDFNFLDLQRILVPNGSYDLELYIADMNTSNKPYFIVEKVNVEFDRNKIMISDIQLLESLKKTEKTNILSKAGYDIIPYIINYYPKTVDKLTFYAEIYNTNQVFGKDEPFIVNYYIESWEQQNILSNYNRLKREISKETHVIIGEFQLKDLPSGNYNVVVSVRDKNNELKISQKFFFYRSNPDLAYNENDFNNIDLASLFVTKIMRPDTLRDYINCLYPISTEMERLYARNNLKKDDVSSMQKFFYNFWYSRDAVNPEKAWRDYANEVQKVNKSFGTGNRKGYETDRGRVYLQYGAPNSITKSEHEPSAYPYEIWHYYTLRNQNNRRFVFYSREFATNDYELIHSDALGEINDPRWQIKIHKRDTPTHSLDPEDSEKHWGGRVNDYYRNPR